MARVFCIWGLLVAGTAVAATHGQAVQARSGATLYVSRLGDHSDGTSWAKAFRTIQAALAAIPDERGGHRVVVRPDTYIEANLHPAHKGAAGAHNILLGDFDGRLGSGTSGWVIIDASDPVRGFKSYDWWGTMRATQQGWSKEHTEPTFSSMVWDRWRFQHLYATGGDGGLFWDCTDQVKPFTVIVEDCVGIGRAFGGGVANCLSRHDEPTTFRRCHLWCLDWWGDASGAYVRVENKVMPDRPDVVFDDCTLVGPDNALKSGNPGFDTFTRVQVKNSRLVSLNFSQPHGTPSTGIIHSTMEGRQFHVDLEDCTLMGFKVFGAGKGKSGEQASDISYSTKGSVLAYVQFQQEVPQGIHRLGHWPAEVFQHIIPPAAQSTPQVLLKEKSIRKDMCEIAPIVWQGKLCHVEVIRPAQGGVSSDYYLTVKDAETDVELARFAEGYSLASACVHDGTLYVFASRFESQQGPWNDVTLFASQDLKNWKSQVVIKQQQGEHLFNSSVYQGAGGFVMAYESNDPAYPAFTIKFAQSNDLTTWTTVPDAVFGTNRYTACPCIRYVGGYYYLMYLEGRSPEHFFQTYIARSKDLKSWELSTANPLLSPSEVGEGINASDPEIIEVAGKTYVYYSVGDQLTWMNIRRAVYAGSLQGFSSTGLLRVEFATLGRRQAVADSKMRRRNPIRGVFLSQAGSPRLANRRLAAGEQLEPRIVLDGRLLISEFVAGNDQGLQDEDGDRPDWIEVTNAGDAAISLSGWHLTDDAENPGKWTFPDISLQPLEYLVVFASGKDRAAAAAALHTNFQLNAAGEYLALIEPDGTTVAGEFAPAFPPQVADVAFGIGQTSRDVTAIGGGSPLTTLVPTAGNGGSTLATDWTAAGFDDSSWTAGQTSVGYDTSGEFAPLIGTDVRAMMQNVNASIYARYPFELEHPRAVYQIQLDMLYNDGFIAYLNGVEVARRNAPADATWESASKEGRRDADSIVPEAIDLTAYRDLLMEGLNVLAFHGLNTDARGSDFLLSPTLIARIPQLVSLGEPRYIKKPTPAAPNGTVNFGGVVLAPDINPQRGYYEAPIEVTIRADTLGATLVYTTDGSTPRLDNGTLVPAPDDRLAASATLPIGRTTTLRVAAFRDDFLPADSVTHTYFFTDDIVNQDFQAALDAGFPAVWQSQSGLAQPPDYGLDPDVVGTDDLFDGRYRVQFADALTSIPTISIVTDMEHLFGPQGAYSNPTRTGIEWERPISLELIYPDGSTTYQANAGLRIQGGAFRRLSLTNKKSFRLEFREEYGPTKLRFPLFGPDAADQFDEIVLRANNNDGYQWDAAAGKAQYIRDEWMRRTQLAMGHTSPHGNFMHLYINGFYWGLYNPVERPEASFSATYLGGDKTDWDVINFDSVIDGSDDAWNELIAMADEANTTNQIRSNRFFQRMQGNRRDGSDDPAYEALVDMNNMIDYLILNFYGGNLDWPHRNWFAARQRGAESTGFKFYSWDAEAVLNLWSGLNTNAVQVNAGAAQVYSMLLANQEFRLQFADRVQKHFFNGGVFYVDPDNPQWDSDHPERNVPAALYRELADMIETAMIAESSRWGDQHRTELPYTLDDWIQERNTALEGYFPQRSQVVLGQLRDAGLYPMLDAPSFHQHGGLIEPGFQLAIDGPGTVYFTLDGSDPRVATYVFATETAGLAPSAAEYQGPIALTGDTIVKARTLLDGVWSALNEAIFVADPFPIRVSEIMYHSVKPEGTGTLPADDFEFVELVNTSGAQTIHLKNASLAGGVSFTFPAMELAPNEHVVVARNPSALRLIHGDALNLAGPYSGRLDNAGEVLRLVDPHGEVIQEFAYDDAWHPRSDGLGQSLEVLDPSSGELARWAVAGGWLPSIARGGTPGAERSSAPATPADMNLDGSVDAEDAEDLVLAFREPESYTAKHGVPVYFSGDSDGDGDLDFDDIAAFQRLVASPTRLGGQSQWAALVDRVLTPLRPWRH